MKVTEDTKRVAQEALDYLLMYPERHDQATWVRVNDCRAFAYDEEDASLCNTTMCVAGIVQWQQDGHISERDVDVVAAELLGLNHAEQVVLFLGTNNAEAVDALTAIANGDKDRFYALLGDDIKNY